MEEALGVNRSVAKVIWKTIKTFSHKACTSFGISPISYGGKNEWLVGTSQENIVLGAICRDQLCLVFKYIEYKKIGVSIVLPLTLKSIYRIYCRWYRYVFKWK